MSTLSRRPLEALRVRPSLVARIVACALLALAWLLGSIGGAR